jgi:PHD/YefM family antitoxin component YafN of YafNO toxin-antitoxin module
MVNIFLFSNINGTLHLISSKANQQRLDEAVSEMEQGLFVQHELLDK